tara:strand:- start:692 stop:1042 length:351 start_codon:yes stop_codon:yes gene_type:complete
MKFETLREGMVFEKVKGPRQHTPSGAIILDNLFEVVYVARTEIRDYFCETICIGNLKSKKTAVLDMSELSNQSMWRYHEGAEVKEVTVKQVQFLNREPLQITSAEVGISTEKKSKP